MHRSTLVLVASSFAFAAVRAQVPTQCFEIESILVNACNGSCPGADEQDNEMVRFITGPAPLDIDDFDITWPTASDSWDGFVQNTTTADRTAAINATIQGCGYLLEPPGGIIPPGKRVIAVTSTEVCPTGNSFAALMDTLYIVYQMDGNPAGHFANTGSGTRTLIMRHGACSDTAVYEPALLVNESGVPANQDGGTVLFSWPGVAVPTYVNYGCQAPFIPLVPTIVSGGGDVACGATTALVAEIGGEAASYHWEGGTGTFSDPHALSTNYTLGPGDGGTFTLSFCVVSPCGDTLCDQVSLTSAGAEVTISGDNRLCGIFTPAVLTASGADSYEWSTGATTATITIPALDAGPYWVVGTTACGTDTAYIDVTIMTHVLHYAHVSCTGANDGELDIQPMGAAQPCTFSWSTGGVDSLITGLAPGTYTYTVTDAQGCSQSGSYTITEPTPLVLTVGNDTTICAGGYAVLNATASGGTPAYAFTWSPEGPLVFPTATTTYEVVVHDQHGCTLPSQTLTVTVGGAPAVFTNTPAEGCGPLCVTFTAGTPGTAHTWDFGDGSTGTGESIEHCYTATGVYDVSLTVEIAGGDCPGFVLVEDLVHVLDAPVADFTASPQAGLAPLVVEFTDATVPPGASLEWDFGDQTSATGPDPSHVYVAPGVYTVVLEATTGCSDTDTLYITVLENVVPPDTSWILVPNVMSPNGDGHNDAFLIRSQGLAHLTVDIFNRWGQQVGDIRRVGEGWDGRSKSGEPVPAGTYFFVLEAAGHDGRTYDVHGAFTVVR